MNAGDKCLNYSRAKTRMEKLKIHASETAWCGTKFDAILTNDTTIDDLFAKVKDLVQDHPVATGSLPCEEAAGSLHIPS